MTCSLLACLKFIAVDCSDGFEFGASNAVLPSDFQELKVAFFIAYMLGAVISLILIALKKKTMKSETAFGTYLAVGTLVAMFFADNIINWYLNLLR